jgi:outer membrane protein assembly factor BamB
MRPSRTRRTGAAAVVVFALALLCGACTNDWATWGNGVARQGYNGAETTLATSNVSQLTHEWSVDLGAYINSSPIFADDVSVNGTATDLVFVGTEHGVEFAVNTSGQIVWLIGLGARQIDCPDTPDKVYGVSAPGVYDRAGKRLFVAGGDGFVYALDPATGAILPGWPVRLTNDPVHEVVFSAPTLVGNHLYFELASHCDARPYHGRVVDIDPTARAIAHTFYVTGSATGPDGGGIWGWGGASVDTANGDVYVATGNSFANPENSPYADSVVRLSADLQVKAFHTPVVGIVDDDFGSTPMLFQKSGCPPQLVAGQKNGSLYLYDRDTIASGPRQRVVVTQPNLIGVSAYSPVTQLVYVIVGKDSADGVYKRGLLAFRLNANCQLELAWQYNVATNVTTPTVANGVVYFTGGFSGKIYAVDAATGAPLWDSGTSVSGRLPATPIVVNGHLYAVGYDKMLHSFGLPPAPS